jgi:hypothetical protein
MAQTKRDTGSRLSGHVLLSEGAAYSGKSRVRYHGTGGIGKAMCSCGVSSPVLDSGSKRKQWHREHKEAVRKAGGGTNE